MSITARALRSASATRRAKTRTVLGVKWTGVSGGAWEVGGWLCESHEGAYGGWSLYSPAGELSCVGSLKAATRLVLSGRGNS